MTSLARRWRSPRWWSALLRSPSGLWLSLVLASLAATFTAAAAVVWFALHLAEQQMVEAFNQKAIQVGLSIRRDLQRAVDLGIPLREIPGMEPYLADIAGDDPEVRFVAVTDAGLDILYYGGIGAQRLAPILSDPAVRTAALGDSKMVVGLAAPAEGVDFSISSLPVVQGDSLTGLVVVGIQRRQIGEQFTERWPVVALGALLIVILASELAGLTVLAAYRRPLERLGRLMVAASRGDLSILADRLGQDEVGQALLRFNMVIRRMRDLVDRCRAHAEEVRSAVFDRDVARQVAVLSETLLHEFGDSIVRPPQRVTERQTVGVQFAVLVLCAAAGVTAAAAAAPAGAAGAGPGLSPASGRCFAALAGGLLAGGAVGLRLARRRAAQRLLLRLGAAAVLAGCLALLAAARLPAAALVGLGLGPVLAAAPAYLADAGVRHPLGRLLPTALSGGVLGAGAVLLCGDGALLACGTVLAILGTVATLAARA